MEDQKYFVITAKNKPIGPITADIISLLVAEMEVGPHSAVRRAQDINWTTMRDIADSLGLELPDERNWKEVKKAKESEDRSNLALGCGIGALVIWGGLSLIGLGFLFLPFVMFIVIYGILGLFFTSMSGIDVLAAPMWTDVRKKRRPGQGLQFVALTLAMIVVAAYYLYQFNR